MYGEVEVKLHAYLTLALDGGECSGKEITTLLLLFLHFSISLSQHTSRQKYITINLKLNLTLVKLLGIQDFTLRR
jgi:hypothetical protein